MPQSDLEILSALNQAYIDSVQNSDIRRFDEILAPDFRATLADGSYLDRAAFLAHTAAPVHISGLAAHDVEIRILGETAIIHGRTSYLTSGGTPGAGRYTDIWARRGGRWLAVAAHVTRNR